MVLKNRQAEYGEWMPPVYSITGERSGTHWPHVNNVPSLKEAIALAIEYPRFEPNGACTRIARHFRFRSLNGYAFVSGMSHEWYVFPNGRLVLNKCFKGYRTGAYDWIEQIPSSSKEYASYDLDAQMWDLVRIADHLGYREALNYLFIDLPNCRDRERLRPSYRQSPKLPLMPSRAAQQPDSLQHWVNTRDALDVIHQRRSYVPNDLDSQMWDLELIAHHLGHRDAVSWLFDDRCYRSIPHEAYRKGVRVCLGFKQLLDTKHSLGLAPRARQDCTRFIPPILVHAGRTLCNRFNQRRSQ